MNKKIIKVSMVVFYIAATFTLTLSISQNGLSKGLSDNIFMIIAIFIWPLIYFQSKIKKDEPLPKDALKKLRTIFIIMFVGVNISCIVTDYLTYLSLKQQGQPEKVLNIILYVSLPVGLLIANALLLVLWYTKSKEIKAKLNGNNAE
jgi:hypothetical protein